MHLLKRLPRRRPGPPERSLALRRLVFLAALPPIFAVAWVGFLWGPALLALVFLAGGHFYSWRAAQRDQPNPRVRVILFAALHLAVGWMCAGLFIGAALPQAQFALYAQAITAFDLRRRSNLFSALGLSMLNLYVAATLSRDYSLLAFALAFASLVLAVFFRAEIEDGAQGIRLKAQGSRPKAQVLDSPTSRHALTSILSFSLSFSLVSFLVFAFTPHLAGRPLIPPFSISLPIPGGVTAQIVNPAVPLVQINGWSNQRSDYYYGFASQLDLRYRGGLSDAVVMYVRSPAWSYWRSHSYDVYNGHAWSQSEGARPKTLLARDGVFFSIPADAEAQGEEVVQSYYIVRDQPNLVFAAYRPAEVYINARELSVDAGVAIRVSQALKAGTTYTVVSRRPDFSPDALRAAPTDYPAEVTARYLQLPEDVSERVRDMAHRLTADAPTAFNKASALRDYLLTIPYDLFPPPQPPNSETVDNFLFVDRRGVCEQYATAHVVMLRVLGIPARLVAGYGAGEYNALSGFYTVRASDAHAWTEVYFPSYGWVPFDPTPGWTPSPYTAPVQRWILSGSLGLLPALPWGALASAGAALFGAALGPLTFLLIPVGLLGLAFLLRALWRGALRAQAARFPAIDRDPNRRRILIAYQAGQKRLNRRRLQAETPREFARRVAREDWDELTAAVEQAAYRAATPPSWLARRAQELAARLRRWV